MIITDGSHYDPSPFCPQNGVEVRTVDHPKPGRLDSGWWLDGHPWYHESGKACFENNLKQMQVLMCPIQMVHVQMLTSFPVQILNRLWRRELEVSFPGCWWCQCPQAHSPPLPARKARVSLLGDLVSQGLCYRVLQKTAPMKYQSIEVMSPTSPNSMLSSKLRAWQLQKEHISVDGARHFREQHWSWGLRG